MSRTCVHQHKVLKLNINIIKLYGNKDKSVIIISYYLFCKSITFVFFLYFICNSIILSTPLTLIQLTICLCTVQLLFMSARFQFFVYFLRKKIKKEVQSNNFSQ